jgi:hypothetical protein
MPFFEQTARMIPSYCSEIVRCQTIALSHKPLGQAQSTLYVIPSADQSRFCPEIERVQCSESKPIEQPTVETPIADGKFNLLTLLLAMATPITFSRSEKIAVAAWLAFMPVVWPSFSHLI